jgi:hypothetical protein
MTAHCLLAVIEKRHLLLTLPGLEFILEVFPPHHKFRQTEGSREPERIISFVRIATACDQDHAVLAIRGP